jgi:hypothetical protein
MSHEDRLPTLTEAIHTQIHRAFETKQPNSEIKNSLALIDRQLASAIAQKSVDPNFILDTPLEDLINAQQVVQSTLESLNHQG